MKGQITNAKTPAEYFAGVEPDRKVQIKTLHELIEKTTGLKGRVEYGMLAYGSYHYKSKSGREGDWMCIGLASNKQYISLYALDYRLEAFKSRLPKANIGKGCTRFKSIKDVDLKVIKEIVVEAAKGNGKTVNY